MYCETSGVGLFIGLLVLWYFLHRRSFSLFFTAIFCALIYFTFLANSEYSSVFTLVIVFCLAASADKAIKKRSAYANTINDFQNYKEKIFSKKPTPISKNIGSFSS